ncbi:NUDIX hydrolase [Nocardioides bruguierae]|uniref:NUDIX hydrolase n=1 Tax=Nocardioides bruguierae TaxID=2945102 RepID=UPI0020202480|nr:NUDIX hydrolase [Nocardioides bruguierae]MCL8027429.1 NUDIX hydrolase [Nocardioides bruguierae]
MPHVPIPPAPLPDSLVEAVREHAAGRRQAAEPRDAATVLLLRDGPGGVETYYLLRQRSMAFAAGMAVYPGGGVDARDASADLPWAGPPVSWWAERLGCTQDEARAVVAAAVRETFEESGVLLASEPGSQAVVPTLGDVWEADRAACETRACSLSELLTRRGLVLRSDLLAPWDAWLTPEIEPRRYRTWFLVAALPEGCATRDVSGESSSVEWAPAGAQAARAETGEVAMMPPTYLTSLEVGVFDSVAAVLADGAGRRLEMFCPQPVETDGEWRFRYPDRLRRLLVARGRA